MKKIILLLLLVSGVVNAQDLPKLQLTPNGVEPIVVNVVGVSAEALYQKSLNWIQEMYKNPEHVLKAKIVNEKIRIEAISRNAWQYKLMGMKQSYDTYYTLEISFKEGKYRLEYIVGDFIGAAFTYKAFFKNTGEPKKVYGEAIPSLEESMNNLSLIYYNYVAGVTAKNYNKW